jgi:hypothetical protein
MSSVAAGTQSPRRTVEQCRDAPQAFTVTVGPFSPSDATVTLERRNESGVVTANKTLPAEAALAGPVKINFPKDENWTLVIRKDGYATQSVPVLPPCAGGGLVISLSLEPVR